jgi:thioredoxin 1
MKSFDEHINGATPVLVDFFAEWCGPCKYMPPILKEVKQKAGDKITILKVDIDKAPALSSRFQIRSVPTIMAFQNGNVVWRKSGVASAGEIIESLKQVL